MSVLPPPVARDRAAEIDAAIIALTAGAGPVSVRATDRSAPASSRLIQFVHTQDLADEADGSWSKFSGEVGQLSGVGPTLRVGLGPADSVSLETARGAAALAGQQLTRGSVRVVLPTGGHALIEAVVDGLAGGYPGSEPVEILIDPEDLASARRGILAADTVRLVRRLVSAPANVLTPAEAARWSTEIAARSELDCTVLGPDELREQGFGAICAIGSGSINGPRLVRLTHHGEPGGPVLSLVGKGITFDSGGLSLKSPAAMQNMRLDVGGAATILAVMGALSRVGSAVTVDAVLPFAENLPGPGAVRPGDVVTAWSGTQIQILDSDFEGRVVLADALAFAAARNPTLMVDLATLTYQAEIALGPEIAAVFARDDEAAARLLEAAAGAGEPMWQLPWATRYLDQVRTGFGVRNHPLHDSGRAITAALFLGEFVPESIPWVHCDMTGPAWAGDASGDGATGFGARTLLTLIEMLGG